MALSITLHQAGVDHVIVDKLTQGQSTSRAAVIHAQTLETLEPLGVVDALVAEGLKLETFSVRDRDRALVGMRFDGLPTKYNYLLMLPQNVTERVLADRIGTLGGMVHRGVTATKIVQDGDGVCVTTIEGGQENIIAARYAIGADGMHSVIRQAAGIEFEGAAYEESFVLADVHLDWPLGRDEVSLFFSPDGLVVVAPLPDGSFRVVATLDNAPEHPGASDIQGLIDRRGPAMARSRVVDLIWSSRFRIHHRIAKAYRNGRLLLMGDAAHVHSPAGGQGMNTGLIDAVILGQLLADVVKGRRPEAALDIYQSVRRPAAEHVLALAGRLTGMATTRSPLMRFLRNLLFWFIDINPIAKRRITMNLSGLARASLAQLPKR
jgi:2-polyprenyl-6-methoxyphenol hydroxylase-like FAD-dependent oxidoreductase